MKESRNEAEGDEEAKGDMEDFIRQEIESPGLMPSATYCHEISNTQLQGSQSERIRHTSTALIRDKKILQERPQRFRLNPQPLSRDVSAQDDWLRVNFTLFKIGEQLVQRHY